MQSATVLVVIGLLMHPYHCLCPTAVLGSGRRNTEPSRCMVFIDLIKKKKPNKTQPNCFKTVVQKYPHPHRLWGRLAP